VMDLSDLGNCGLGGIPVKGNDVWGWTDEKNDDEYALMGTRQGIVFIRITDPLNPVCVGGLPTSPSTWMDIKTYTGGSDDDKNLAVIGSESKNFGVYFFDLDRLKDAALGSTFQEDFEYTGVSNSHNVFINNDSGYGYFVGSSTCGGGLVVMEMSSGNYAGCFSGDGYTHDVQCVIYKGPDLDFIGREICFASNEDSVTIVDVNDKDNMFQISKNKYDKDAYTHQGWLNDAQTHFIFNDELDEKKGFVSKTTTHVMDVTSLKDVQYLGNYGGRTRAIDHNLYVHGDYVYQANYQAGFNLLKIKNISTLEFEEAGFFDIYPASDLNEFNGAWSSYAGFKSGTIIVSGLEQGLFMLKRSNKCVDDPNFMKTRGGKNQIIARTCKYISLTKARAKKWCNKRKRGELISEICCQTCS